jgi:hypothetical protein
MVHGSAASRPSNPHPTPLPRSSLPHPLPCRSNRDPLRTHVPQPPQPRSPRLRARSPRLRARSPDAPAVPQSSPRPQSIHAQHAVIHAGRGILAPRAGRNPSPLVLEGRLICAPKIHAHSMGSTTAAALQGFNPRRTLLTTTPHIDTRASSAIHKWSTFVGDPLPCSSPFYPLP